MTAIIKKPGTVVRPPGPDPTLHVITPVFNPVRYHSRYTLYREYEARMAQVPGINLITVELAFGDRAFEVTQAGNPNHVQLRTDCEIWYKEGMVNAGFARLPSDWQYVAWIDGDVQFINDRWSTETVHQLQHYRLVQLFQDAIDMGPSGNIIAQHAGFAHQYVSGAPRIINGNEDGLYYGGYGQYPFWHPGFAWAATRDAINDMGGLLDWAILGSGDHHMALAWIGEAARSVPADIEPAYLTDLLTYQDRCERLIKRNIGYVPGTLMHSWHGSKPNRKYVERWKIAIENRFDPRKDLRKDSQGLWLLDPDRVKLRDDIRAYFRQRNEDSIDE
jgi:hypothetical protein